MPRANDGDRTRDTNLEGWDVTATPHSQGRLTWNRTRDDRLEGGSYIRLTMSP